MNIKTDFVGTILHHRYVYGLEEGPYRRDGGSNYYDGYKYPITLRNSLLDCGTMLIDTELKILRPYKWHPDYNNIDYNKCCILERVDCNWKLFINNYNFFRAEFAFHTCQLPKPVLKTQYWCYLRGEFITQVLPEILKNHLQIIKLKELEPGFFVYIIVPNENDQPNDIEFITGENYMILF